ncbi:MAG: PIN domain-containing protein [Acidobacteriaceae bacterium]
MKVLVDTCVWSLFLRRQNKAALNPEEQRLAGVLRETIQDGRIAIIGPIRQEVLSGIRDQSQFRGTEEVLEPFPDEELTTADYVEAARSFNLCRDRGVECGPVDILICAVGARRQFSVLTNDRALIRCLEVLGIPHP